MKQLRKIMMIIVGALLLSACASQDLGPGTDESSLNIVTTTTMITDLVEIVGGEHVSVTGLMGPGVDPHYYQPSTSDVVTMGDTDVMVYNGLTLEERFSEVFEELPNRGTELIVIADSLDESTYLNPMEDDDLAYDPHIWFSVDHWQTATQYVADQLSEMDAENAASYQDNAQEYIKELEQLATYINQRVEEVPEDSRYLVTAHDAFQYFGEEFDFEVVGLQGLNTQTEAGTGDISRLADFLVNQNIRAVFVESSVSPRNIEALIEAAASRGHEVENAGELYSDALGSEEDDADTYIKMYRSNIDTIVDALKQ
ncbi:metal ABC transporter solute-binding protein, Zn/Mn family [Alkalibacterium sp. MB6]|uniref:metal ABC transporter solute-binding protein, Zn/Mn family n=1 Tax=Alkalibacterium sp. MB6 TaxID=2081965 RepID=UPI00137B8F6B|nr:zinc ABC transporter substrate-binding protein [Alkalibacterium sp. MB6]